MNDVQVKILEDLKAEAEKLGHSPKRREVQNIALRCYRHFKSFNEAKKILGLKIVNVRVNKFLKNAFKIDKDAARIAAYLTSDGHLYKSLKGFMYSSKDIKNLKEFEKIVKRKFGDLREIYHFNNGRVRNTVHKIYFFNKIVCKYLFSLGIPKGDKVIQEFNVPRWVKDKKEFSREYLKIIYLCEGSFKEEQDRTPRILLTFAKEETLLDSGLRFMETLRSMLKKFDIDTKKPFVTSRRVRKKDGKITKDTRFRIEIKDNNKFIKEIGWLK